MQLKETHPKAATASDNTPRPLLGNAANDPPPPPETKEDTTIDPTTEGEEGTMSGSRTRPGVTKTRLEGEEVGVTVGALPVPVINPTATRTNTITHQGDRIGRTRGGRSLSRDTLPSPWIHWRRD